MKGLVFGTLLLLLVCSSFTLPLARSDEGNMFTWRPQGCNITYRISNVSVRQGQIVTLYVNLTTTARIYDLRLEVLSNPVQLVTEPVWGFDEIESGLPQPHTFRIRIPDDAAKGTRYSLDLLLTGYNDAPWLTLWSWHLRGFLFWPEHPQYTGDTRDIKGNSIVITVV